MCHPAARQEEVSPELIKNEWRRLTHCEDLTSAVMVEPHLITERTPLMGTGTYWPSSASLAFFFALFLHLTFSLNTQRGRNGLLNPRTLSKLCIKACREIMSEDLRALSEQLTKGNDF